MGTARRALALFLPALLTASLVAVAGPAEGQVGLHGPLKVVLIGDSYSAGNGAGSYYGPRGCYRSRTNWAERYVAELRRDHAVTFVNRACSGAVTIDLLTERSMDSSTETVVVPGRVGKDDPAARRALDDSGRCRTSYPDEERITVEALRSRAVDDGSEVTFRCRRALAPQIAAIGEDTDLVLFSSGGNDLGFATIVEQCFAPALRDPGDCRDNVEAARAGIPAVEQLIANVFARLRERMRGDARVALLAYPHLATSSRYALRSLSGRDTYEAGAEIRRLGEEGENAQRQAVQAAGAPFVTFVDSVKAHFAGHEPDAAVSRTNPNGWLHEFVISPRLESYHYNPRGHQEIASLLIPQSAFGADEGVSDDELGEGSVDIVLTIDTTGSMGDDIAAVQEFSSELVERVASRTRSFRFALVTYRDFPERTGDPEDYAANVDLDFTDDTSQILDAVGGLTLGYGGDGPETVFSGLATAIGLPWRPGVKKLVVQLGDAPPLSPEPFSELTPDDIVEAALAVDPAEVYAVDVASAGGPSADLVRVVEGTNGAVVSAPTPTEVAGSLVEVIDEALSKPYAWAGGPYVATIGTELVFDASGSFDSDGPIVSYEWDFDGDGTYDRATADAATTHAFPSAFDGYVAVRVTDAQGASAVGTARGHASVDGDEVPDERDNCAADPNHGQEDEDGDGVGDACDPEPGFPTEGDPDVVELLAGDDDPATTLPPVLPGEEAGTVAVKRLAGPDRYATAAAISGYGFPDGSDSALLTRGDVFADALAAGTLQEGPLLLVPPCTPEPGMAGAELDRLEAASVGVLGGEQAVCDLAVAELTGAGRVPYRMAGPDRFATAVEVARRGFPTGADTVYLADADDAPDALAAGPLTEGPILLVSQGSPSQLVLDEIERLAPQRVVALGGTAAVAQETLEAAAGGRPTLRLGGATRLETAVEVSRHQYGDGEDGPERVLLARADVFADALSAGALDTGPLLLVPSCGPLPAAVAGELERLAPQMVIALGGTAAICDDLLDEAGLAAARGT